MATEWNYARAQREVAAPLFAALPEDMHEAFQIACKHWRYIDKDKIDWEEPYDVIKDEDERKAVVKDLERLADILDTGDLETLGKASEILYYYGHWAHTATVTVKFGDHPERVFLKDDFDAFSPTREAKDYIRMMEDMYPAEEKTPVTLTPTILGPDNQATGGAYWRISGLIKTVIISRTRHERVGFAEYYGRNVAKKLGLISESFKDHVPGTEYEREELPDLFNQVLPNHVVCEAVTGVNHKPHPPVIGQKAMEAASKSGTLGGDCPCDHPGCLLSIAEHTSELAMILKLDRDLPEQEFLDIIQSEHFRTLYRNFDVRHLGFAPGGKILVPEPEAEAEDEEDETHED